MLTDKSLMVSITGMVFTIASSIGGSAYFMGQSAMQILNNTNQIEQSNDNYAELLSLVQDVRINSAVTREKVQWLEQTEKAWLQERKQNTAVLPSLSFGGLDG